MKFCPVVPEICHGQIHGPRKERRKRRKRKRIIIIIIRNGAKTISLPNFVWKKGYVLLLINAGVRSSVSERKKSRRLLHYV
jgi:hypothetical protein